MEPKTGTNEPIYETEITQRTDVSLPRRLGGGMDWESGTSGCKPGWKTRSYCIAQGTIVNILG